MSLGIASSSQNTGASGFKIIDKYIIHEQLGVGTYSTVCRATSIETQRVVAIKRIQDTSGTVADGELSFTTVREITILKALSGHPNIVSLLDCEAVEAGTILVLEFLPTDLFMHMAQLKQAGSPLGHDARTILIFMTQLLAGIAFCHQKGFLHRDLKPSNLLVDPHTRVLKITDFGLARRVGDAPEAESLSNNVRVSQFSDRIARCVGIVGLTCFPAVQVVTLQFRAPELLVPLPEGTPAVYDTGIDMWACGCILAEMVTGRMLFEGCREEWVVLLLAREIRKYGLLAFLRYRPQEYDLTGCVQWEFDLMWRFLQFDAEKRLSAVDALKMPIFSPQHALEPLWRQ
ncbi:kinase-like domain-containing protein [Lenzites betulinus]|nr:kinase-like domain-containing protein [Lenzites betulinus]